MTRTLATVSTRLCGTAFKPEEYVLYLVEMVDASIGAARVHVLLRSHAVDWRDGRVIERPPLVSSVRETSSDSDSSKRILHKTNRRKSRRKRSVFH